MNQNDGQLIRCPKCYEVGKTQYLGKIKDNGELLVLRFHHGTTIIKADKYEIICGCGYTASVEGTVVINRYGQSTY